MIIEHRAFTLLLVLATSLVMATDEPVRGDLARSAPPIETLPASRGGQDRLGASFSSDGFDRWIEAPAATSRPEAPAPKKTRLTLYRWWTDGCPHCEASLPALEGLRKKYGDDGLRVVGVYHPKPPREVADRDVLSAARERGFHGAIAVDEDWSVLRASYLRGKRRGATSISFLVDADGVIRFVHPGPDLFPSSDPEFAEADADFKRLERAIVGLLAPAE